MAAASMLFWQLLQARATPTSVAPPTPLAVPRSIAPQSHWPLPPTFHARRAPNRTKHPGKAHRRREKSALGHDRWRCPGHGPAHARAATLHTPGDYPAYARDHDRGAITVADGTDRPGDTERAACARLRHCPAHRARRRPGPDLADPPAGHLPLDHPAAGRRAADPGRGRIRPGPAANPLRGNPGRTPAGRGVARHPGRAHPGRPLPPATQTGPAGSRRGRPQ